MKRDDVTDIASAALERIDAELPGVLIFDAGEVRRRSRDRTAMLSPSLSAELADHRAGAAALPASEEEVVAIVAACARHGVPIVPRGAGTGTFAQAVPMAGGLILDLSRLTGVCWSTDGAVRVRAGTLLSDIDTSLAGTGRELRMYPSSRRMATAAGFVVGGHGGIGSIRHGVLGDRGNLLGLRVLTIEPEPRALELRGDQADLVQFSFGTSGVVTEVEFPLTTAWPWRDVIYVFDAFSSAVSFAHQLTLADGLDVKNAMPASARVASYYTPLAEYLPPGKAAVMTMVAPHSLEGVTELAASWGGVCTFDVATGDGPRRLPLYEYTWGHAVWWIRKAEAHLAVVLALLPEVDPAGVLQSVLDEVGEPTWPSVPCQRIGGRPGLQVGLGVDSSVPGRVEQVTAAAERAGCLVADIHRPHLSEGSIRGVDERRRRFLAEVDPAGLCNPGRMADPEDDAAAPNQMSPNQTGPDQARHGWSERFDGRVGGAFSAPDEPAS
jgi:FAD/FMN-containing dehydrogenase